MPAAALLLASVGAHAAASDVGAYKVAASFLQGKHPIHVNGVGNPNSTRPGALRNAAIQAALRGARKGSGLPGIDTLVNFTGQFSASPNLDASGNPLPDATFAYAMVGHAPGTGVTYVNAPIIPVTVELLDANGTVALDPTSGAPLISNPHDKLAPVLGSPIFAPALFTSSRTKTQYTDAVFRAQFWGKIGESWHTLLAADVEPGLTMRLPLGSYHYATNADGTCCAFILADAFTFQTLLFPPVFPVDNTTIIGAAELSGAMTTRDITSFLFPDTYLYQGTPANCCILGFHSFDFEPGTAKNGNLPRAYVMIYASWISPGLFGPGFEDVTALSHEMAETFNDPFIGFDNVHNITPWWLSGPLTGFFQCQNLLEDGDVVEVLSSDVTFPVSMPNGFLYHPQNVALLNWFEFQSPSTALGGAYSYPNPESLPALSAPQKVNCAP
ncbi:MAG: hypothetical protein PVS2B3_06320 [Steroidobacteraceae bacterium]